MFTVLLILTPFSRLLADPQSAVGATVELAYDSGLPSGQMIDQLGGCTMCQTYQGVLFSLPEEVSSSVLKKVRFYAGGGKADVGVHIMNTTDDNFTAGADLTPKLVVTISEEKWYEVSLPDVAVPSKFWVFFELAKFNVAPFYDEGRTGPSWNGFKPDQLVMGVPVDGFKRPQGDFLIRAYITSGAATTDTTPPTTPAVTDDGTTTTSASQLHATWSSSDDESDVVEYQYAIGTTTGGTDILGWTSVGTNTEVTRTGLTLTAATKYFICVKAKNGAGLWSEIGISNGTTVAAEGMAVEDIPPAGGTVQTADGKIIADFPANTAVGALTVTIEDIEPASATSTPQGFKAGGTYFVLEITDAGGNAMVTLSQPVTITVKYSDEDVAAAGGDPNDLVLAYYDETASEWKTLDTTVNTTDKSLSANTTHLSMWAVLAKTSSENAGGDGEVGGCCASSSADASVGDTAIAWGALGLCSGTAYFFAGRVGKRKGKK